MEEEVVAVLAALVALAAGDCGAGLAGPGSPSHVQLNLSHPVFLVEPVLLAGLSYKVGARGMPGVKELGVSAGGTCIFSGPGPPANFTVPPVTNLTFRVTYRLEDDPMLLELRLTYPVSQECEVTVGPGDSGEVDWRDLPSGASSCGLLLPPDLPRTGLLLTFLKLNVPCSQGSVVVVPERVLCGKLEELAPEERSVYLASGPGELRLVGGPVFRLLYRRVDPCHNLTLRGRNASLEAAPSSACTYNILLPYGYRAAYTLRIEGAGYTEALEAGEECGPEGVRLEVWEEGEEPWLYCAPGGPRELRRISASNYLRLRISLSAPHHPPLIRIRYEAVGDSEVVGGCGWPGVASQALCVWLSADRQSWPGAEAACSAHGGHLASVTTQREQDLIDILILNSPEYREEEAFWLGGTDMRVEGDFRWTDSRPFAYTNWFEGGQPNDDGLSGQDCLELRRTFGQALSPALRWNDRDCAARNRYVCEALPSGVAMPSLRELLSADCNRTVSLSLEEPTGVVTSPGFPDLYPDDATCTVTVTAPPAFPVLVEFEELVLEAEPSCSYDYVEVTGSNGTRRFCGDLSDRLKLLRQVFAGPKVRIKFVSDYSHHFPGFKARVSVGHSWPECGNDKLWPMFNNSCYLVVSYPEVSWNTANKICNDIKGELASVHSPSEDRFVVTKIRESLGYSTSAVYWLGATYNGSTWAWGDHSLMDFTGWVGRVGESVEEEMCLGLQYRKAPSPELPSGLYWTSQPCDMVGGYVCKKKNQGVSLRKEVNVTVNGTEGRLVSPGYPGPYPIGTELWSRVQGPPHHRLVIRFTELDLEPQADCLYDWIQVDQPPVRLCGHKTPEQLQRLRVVTTSNSALIHFHSDYSVSGGGWALSWRAVDVTGCPLQTTTAREGQLYSPNYPDFLLSSLDCATTILAPEGKRVWLEVEDWDLPQEALGLDLGGGAGRLVPYSEPDLLSEGTFLSTGERMHLTLRTGDQPEGRGYKAKYKTVDGVSEERVVLVTGAGRLLHLNYPLRPPTDTNFTLRLMAPLGQLIQLHFHQAGSVSGERCEPEESLVEVTDPYGDKSQWLVCKAPLTFTSFLNSIRVKQVLRQAGFTLNATVTLIQDPVYRSKLREEGPVESCTPNPCQNGGRCVTSHTGQHSCQCVSHFTGLLCGLTACEMEPCQFGNCSLTGSGFRCTCFPGYLGRTCDLPQRPCASNPCDSRGECIQTNRTAFKCKCHAWWEGARCEKRMLHIPYKPLSARMLEEPFWLGLITVTVVLGILGLFWCAKRHFPEKLEKLLAEEDARRPYRNSVRWRGESVGPRSSLLGRLGIRKPSLSQAAPTPRTFSLDDLLKPPTTPSPRKKRNNSTPVKKSCALSEKKEILQQLVSPVEAIPLAGAKPPDPSSSTNAETSFSATGSREGSSKLEKKVTFARLLDKVSSEMSSGSELEAPGPTLSSNSSQPGSDSRSSSETQLHVGGSEPRKGRKTASAESILAMLRGLPGVTESSTSTQAGSEDSPSSGIPDSPPLFPNKNTIQVSVMDPLSAQKSLQNLLQPPTILLEVPNKCLSPIHELPTPAPSPALTPVLGRPLPCGSPPPRRSYLKENDKPASLDLPCPPPLITVTCSMTDAESDADSPPAKPDSGGMCYLSPFSVCSRNDRTASESNLSSSGYSSMASPGPSRCGSNNPLCPTPSPLARVPCDKARRSDSETTSDDPQPESNDEGFGTEEKGEESKGGGECSEGCSEGCSLLRPPSIVVEGESPVSSRSESPLSDKTGLGRFSPMFYGRLTDSDGLYDCGGSSDCCKRKHSGRRKERRRSKSPVSQVLLQVPGKETRLPERSKPSPKRRTRPQPLSSTSSSSAESLNSIRDVTVCLSSEKMGLSEDNHWPGELYINSTPSEDLTSKMLPNEEVGVKSERKISKLRTVGHQIRFLRRLEQSLERSRLSSPERPLLEGRSAKRNSWLKSRLREVPHTD